MPNPILVALLLLLVPFSASAKENCNFLLQCELEGQKFSIDFSSPSGDCAEDDMTALFKTSAGNHGLKIPPNWYSFTNHIAKSQPSICKDTSLPNEFAAYAAGKQRALLFLKASGRPGYDNVMAILLDTEKGDVLDHKILGNSKNNYVAVLKHKNGFKLRLIRDSLSFHKEVNCDCDAPYVDDWLQVSISRDKIQSGWLLK